MNSTLRLRGVDVPRDIWGGITEPGKLGFLLDQFQEFHGKHTGELSISRKHPRYEVKGHVAEIIRITKILRVTFSAATSQSSKIDGAKELFRKKLKDLGEPVNGVRMLQR